ncbi:junctional adhesion molecule 2A-like [Salvelinus sp. IW2-2015]|uniref:junctional adhesion molecule 2A-like n=1 Tax=Salvelinus sp. IW2-2015 TaxID=2691554 RepID=UPI0038D353F9
MDSTGILSLTLLLLLSQSPASFSLTVSTSKAKMEVHENTDAVLSCQFKTEKETNPRIEWKKKGKDIHLVYFDGKFTGSFAGRAKIEGATVTLHAVTQKDSGLYRCEVSAPADHTNLGEVNVTLNVLDPLSMTTLIAGAVGLFLLILMCCLDVCLPLTGLLQKGQQRSRKEAVHLLLPPEIPRTTNTPSPS